MKRIIFILEEYDEKLKINFNIFKILIKNKIEIKNLNLKRFINFYISIIDKKFCPRMLEFVIKNLKNLENVSKNDWIFLLRKIKDGFDDQNLFGKEFLIDFKSDFYYTSNFYNFYFLKEEIVNKNLIFEILEIAKKFEEIELIEYFEKIFLKYNKIN